MTKKIKSVLLIDDDELTNTLHRIILQKSGICEEVESALTVEEAIGLLNARMLNIGESPEVIFIDLNMPGLTGWDFISEYGKMLGDSRRKSVMVILTASINPDDAKKAKSIPEVASYKNKPLTTEMVEEIAELLETK